MKNTLKQTLNTYNKLNKGHIPCSKYGKIHGISTLPDLPFCLPQAKQE